MFFDALEKLVFSRVFQQFEICQSRINKYCLIPEKTYVIGDNPDSEIEIGNVLNMITIQILRDNVIKGNNARYYINSFNDLKMIINWLK